MEATAHVLVLMIDNVREEDLEVIRPLIASSIRTAHERTGCLDLALVIGGNTACNDGKISGSQVVELIYDESINVGASDLPLIVPVPGLGDVQPIPARHMLADTLTRRWREVEQGLWARDQDDILEGLEQKIFAQYLAWQRSTALEPPGWYAGTLPGEGSVVMALGSHRLGLVVANSVFRTLSLDFPANRATLSTAQLHNTVAEPWENWTAANTLSLLTTRLPTPLPTDLDVRRPLFFVGGDSGIDPSSSKRPAWFAVESGRSSLLQVTLRSTAAPEVRDITQRKKERKLSLLLNTTSTSPTPTLADNSESQPHETILDHFYQQVESGRMLAILVSGLPNGSATDIDEFRTRLAIDTFGEVPEPAPDISEVWAAATTRLVPDRLARRLEDLRGDPDTQYPDLNRVLAAPWWHVYDFSASGTVRVVTQSAKTNSALINALIRKPGDRTNDREVTAINGVFDGDIDSVDFGASPEGDTSPRALWLNRLKTELLYHPVVFFAASATSTALWHTLSSLNILQGTPKFPRFLVAPGAGVSGQARIAHSELIHIRESPSSFAENRLKPGTQHMEQGKKRLSESLSARESKAGISLVSTLVDNRAAGSRKFLEGNEPTWGDIVGGFAAGLSVIDRVLHKAFAADDRGRGIVVLRGRAGSGKTTALMQCAYRLHQQGKVVGWLDRSATNSLQVIRQEAEELGLDAIILDDVDIFGSRTYSLLRELSAGGTMVLGAVRNTKLDFVPSIPNAIYLSADEPLTDDDLRALIKVLKNRGLLGILKKYRWGPTRLQELRKICDGSLLVAMIRVVTGKLFEEKVHSEFKQLTDAKAFVYATVCLLESAEVFKNRGIDLVDLLQVASQGPPNPQMNTAIDALVSPQLRLLIRTSNNIIRSKHRAIADTIIKLLVKEYRPLLGQVVKALLLFYAGYAGDIPDSNNPYRRTMIRLLNHALMVELRLPDNTVREIYDSVQDFLEDDFHYWLQRGEFELQRNHLGIAANYFQSSRGCGGAGDPFVDTGWASVTLRASAAAPDDSEKLTAAADALRTLDQVCHTRGGSSEHSFVVMARAGTEWLEKVHKVLLLPDLYASCDTVKGVIALAQKINLESTQVKRAIREYEPRLARLVARTRGVPT